MNTIRQIQALNKRELENVVPPSASWHTDYRDTAYVYIGGLSFDLTEGDIVTIFSQFGEPVWLKLARDKETGKSKGFAWLKYEDQRSTDLAVDNLGGVTILGRIVRVDHARYTKKNEDEDETEFDVAFEKPEQDKDSDRRHRRREHRKHRSKDKRLSDRPHKQINDELERSDEDPMKDYLAKEESKRHQKRRSRERRGSRERHRNRERAERHYADDEDERPSHTHRKHRSSRD